MATTKKVISKKAPAKTTTAKKATPAPEPEVDETEERENDAEETETGQPTEEQLLALGEEINDIIFPDERVDFEEILEKNGEKQLINQLKADAKNIDPTDDFSDESKTTLVAIGVEVEWEKKQAPKKIAPAKTDKIKTKAPAKKQAAGEKKPAIKKVGIIARIIELCQKAGKKGISKDEILADLKDKFPEREEKSMKATINVQVPARINKERDFDLESKDGRYFVK